MNPSRPPPDIISRCPKWQPTCTAIPQEHAGGHTNHAHRHERRMKIATYHNIFLAVTCSLQILIATVNWQYLNGYKLSTHVVSHVETLTCSGGRSRRTFATLSCFSSPTRTPFRLTGGHPSQTPTLQNPRLCLTSASKLADATRGRSKKTCSMTHLHLLKNNSEAQTQIIQLSERTPRNKQNGVRTVRLCAFPIDQNAVPLPAPQVV